MNDAKEKFLLIISVLMIAISIMIRVKYVFDINKSKFAKQLLNN